MRAEVKGRFAGRLFLVTSSQELGYDQIGLGDKQQVLNLAKEDNCFSEGTVSCGYDTQVIKTTKKFTSSDIGCFSYSNFAWVKCFEADR